MKRGQVIWAEVKDGETPEKKCLGRSTPALVVLASFFVFFSFLSGCGASRSVKAPRDPNEKMPAAGAPTGVEIVKSAKRMLGVPYKFGGDSPAGFDCSGLAWWSHRRQGIEIPRVSFKQFGGGLKVSKKNLRAGDLVFFTTFKKGPSHVGIYDGKGGFMHAPSSGKTVTRTDMDQVYWKPRYLGARRYW